MKINHLQKSILTLSLLTTFLGAFSGLIVWLYLKIMTLGIEFIWTEFPQMLYKIGVNRNVYTIIICLIGGLLIGLIQKKHGVFPETLETVIKEIKEKGSYLNSSVHILIILALLPLIFGASLGPEAGLSGVIASLASFIGLKIKYKGEEIRELSEAGVASILGIVFNAPFYGLVNDVESHISKKELNEEDYIIPKKHRKIFKNVNIILATVAAFMIIKLLNNFFGNGFGISRYHLSAMPTINDWKWFIAFVALGIFGGYFYHMIEEVSEKLVKPIKNKRVLVTLIAGFAVAIFSIIQPLTMFSGEHQMADIMIEWQSYETKVLFLIGIMKLFITAFILKFGWRGGHIFPLIFSGCTLGYGLVNILQINPVFGVAVTVTSICGYVIKKPFAVIAILFLCFPFRLVIPISLAALISSSINFGDKANIKEKFSCN